MSSTSNFSSTWSTLRGRNGLLWKWKPKWVGAKSHMQLDCLFRWFSLYYPLQWWPMYSWVSYTLSLLCDWSNKVYMLVSKITLISMKCESTGEITSYGISTMAIPWQFGRAVQLQKHKLNILHVTAPFWRKTKFELWAHSSQLSMTKEFFPSGLNVCVSPSHSFMHFIISLNTTWDLKTSIYHDKQYR